MGTVRTERVDTEVVIGDDLLIEWDSQSSTQGGPVCVDDRSDLRKNICRVQKVVLGNRGGEESN